MVKSCDIRHVARKEHAKVAGAIAAFALDATRSGAGSRQTPGSQPPAHQVDEVVGVEALPNGVGRVTEAAFEALVRPAATLDVWEVGREHADVRTDLLSDPADVFCRIGCHADLAFDVNLLFSLKRAGHSVKEVPIEWTDKLGSKVTANLWRTSLVMFLSVVRLRLVHSPFYRILRPLQPLEAWLYIKLHAPPPRRGNRAN